MLFEPYSSLHIFIFKYNVLYYMNVVNKYYQFIQKFIYQNITMTWLFYSFYFVTQSGYGFGLSFQ
ncbi:hypothetical protein HMPREF0322_02448 [Desulfitobacterium hafniense DP7]|uniref:Uncharacterized protein n=1 Tax=Desulfitobacterium hafniense DP7 TaxID=537010 RepID=G9XNA6_DESHA|nr:hypothetical protein HMPREF0322_02448 [Desulfitobacterium hafniense DP7]